MHGLINRAIQSFVCNTYGTDRWHSVTEDAGLGFSEFEAMLIYDDAQTDAVMRAVCIELGRPESEVLEDLGTYLVSDPKVEALRRLLRFGGETFQDFLHSLDELPERARLAVSDLHLPPLELRDVTAHQFSLVCGRGLRGYGRVMMGILRAMADDYGALVYLEHSGCHEAGEIISITLVEADFAAGRDFDLGARAG
ncbi:MAG: heme NO-binding protein [Rhodobacteraceae bacterium]|nr:heme NO-binding protein [Paracoccaceae bacterium]